MAARQQPAPESPRHPLAFARERAEELVELLRPHCERIEIAGSIRRKRSDVKDIEIVCVPRLIDHFDIFGEIEMQTSAVQIELKNLHDRSLVHPRMNPHGHPQAWGDRYQALVYAGIPVDVFSVLPSAQWGVILALRTGPAIYSKALVTSRNLGGFLPPGMAVREGALYDRGQLVEVPEEEDFFRAIGKPYVAPELRWER